MAKQLSEYSDETWDRFFDFIYDNSDLSDEEIDAELKERGIDPEPAFARVRDALKRHEERLFDRRGIS